MKEIFAKSWSVEGGIHLTREYLREFITLSEVGNFTDAADQLFLSQSTLSRHIKELEAELGVRLFTRTSKSVILNEYGQKFFPYAQRILSVEDECLRAFSDEIHRMNGQLRIGVFVLDEQYKYMDIITEFHKEYRKYKISLIEDRITVLKHCVEKGTCDFAIVFNRPGQHPDNMERITISKDSLVVILPPDHPLASNSVVDLEQLKDEPVIMQDESSFFYQQYIDAMQQVGFSPNINLCNLNTKSILKMVEYGQGITIRPKQLTVSKNNTATAMVDTRPAIDIDIDLIYRKDKPRTAAENDLIGFFREKLKNEQE